MIRKLYFLSISILLSVGFAFGQAGLGTIKGSVIDSKTKAPIPFATVVLFQGGINKGGATANINGEFELTAVAAGLYNVQVRASGYQTKKIKGFNVLSGKINFLNNTGLTKPKDVQELGKVIITTYKNKLITKDGSTQGTTIGKKDIKHLSARSITDIAAATGGVDKDANGNISVRGSRKGTTYYYIDGVKVLGTPNLPKGAIQSVQVITGGVPANYGDLTGGVVAVTTSGPTSKFFGSIEGVSSGFYFKGDDPIGYDSKIYGLDQYAYNLVEGVLSGPLIMKRDDKGNKTEPLLGFLLSVNYKNEKVPRPLFGGSRRVKKSVRESLLANPLRPSADGKAYFQNTLFLRKDDFEEVNYTMNTNRTTISAAGKIDVSTGPTVSLTFGGSFNYNYGKDYSRPMSLLDFENYGNQDVMGWRAYGRFTQRFINSDKKSSSKIKSFYYTLQVDYSQRKTHSYDPHHKDNIFEYGHVGYFDYDMVPTYAAEENDKIVQNGWRSTNVKFTPSDFNPGLSAMDIQYFRVNKGNPIGFYDNLTSIQSGGGLLNGEIPPSVYGIWTSPGVPYQSLQKTERDQLRVTGSASLVVGDNHITIGFEYGQRWQRGWGVSPRPLWTIARQYMNFHISELDKSSPTVTTFGDGTTRYTYGRLNTGYAYKSGTGEYGGPEHNDNQYFFDYNFRKAIGLDPAGDQFVDIDKYDPSIFSIDMFSPDELFNSGKSYITYYGYDISGNKVSGVTDINKYFNEFDENGNYKRFIGAFQPIYAAGYIMDKFSFNDIIFNIGLRVDYFDANQPVLKDKYLFFNARSAATAKKLRSKDPSKYSWVDIPGNIGDDYTVYVNNTDNPTAINGFRNGDVWYNAKGDVIQDPKTIWGSEGRAAPWLLKPGQVTPTADAFKDYKAAINFMPRIAFSFPISDEANFFATYDILTQRPMGFMRFNPVDYQFITNVTDAKINNSGLRPQKTVDYSFGFQQKVSRTSAIKFTAFYKEQRDLIQVRKIFSAYPSTYTTYGNRDFGTVKGFTLRYDLRRTGNLRFVASYTLQFAKGTGSSAESSLSFVNSNQPDMRTISALDFDKRHKFSFIVDYRYGEGSNYNGPSIGDVKLFENMGVNITALVKSGAPYSRQKNITKAALGAGKPSGKPLLTGTRNGSRKPWTFNINLTVDRTWNLKLGKDDEKKKPAYLNVYLRISNLLNTMNVLNVYRATGSPKDDGFLAAAEWQASIQSKMDEQSFRDLYTMRMLNPFNYSIPRTIRLGVRFGF